MSLKNSEGSKNLCGSYLFTMPFKDDINHKKVWNDLVLVEKEPLFKDKTIVIHFPFNYDGPRNVALLKKESAAITKAKGPGDLILIKRFDTSKHASRISFDATEYIEPGFEYKIVMVKDKEDFLVGDEWNDNQPRNVVATFSNDFDDRSKRRTTSAVVSVLLLALVALAGIVGYIQYLNVKRNHKVDPKR